MKSKEILRTLILVLILLASITPSVYALDFPHNDLNHIGCNSCHYVAGAAPSLLPPWTFHTPFDLDDTAYNSLCWSCHNDVDAPYVKTHSSLNTDDSYGNWSVECRECHNPHYQDQFRTYGAESYIVSGSSTGLSASSITQAGAGWEANQFMGMVAYPNVLQKNFNYQVLGNTSDTLMVKGPIDLTRAAVGDTYAVIYGNLVSDAVDRGAIYTYLGASTSIPDQFTIVQSGAGWAVDEFKNLEVIPNIGKEFIKYTITGNTEDTLTVDGPIDLVEISAGDIFKILSGRTGIKTVKFLRPEGANSFADGDNIYDGICEACHTQTTYHRNNSSGNHTHNSGVKCTECHFHRDGFKGSCTACHGSPPVDGTTLVFNPGPTGSTTAGAHDLHANVKGFGCSECHYNTAGSGPTHNNGSVTLGFSIFNDMFQGGIYDGQSGVSYNSTATNPLTQVSSEGNKECSNIYCHSSGQSTTDGNSSTPDYASPVWDDPSSAVCGTCHKVTEAAGLISGSHGEHLGSVGVNGCGDCHSGAANNASSYNSSNHVNGLINVLNSYSGEGAPGNGYGSCSTASCHDDGTGNPAPTPQWGSEVPGCTACHDEIPSTGSHQKHVVNTTFNKAECGDCHDGAVQGLTAPEQHLDTNVDIYDIYAGDLGYPQDKTKGTAYASCSTAYCHSSGQSVTDGNDAIPVYATPMWDNPASAACGTCHKVSEATGLISGSHGAHLGTTGVNGCSDCHIGAANDASSYNSVNHVNAAIDVANTYSAGGAPGNGYGTCSTAVCHEDGTGTMIITPEWGSSPVNCSECHEAIPTTGSHQKHVVTTTFNKAECGDCHDGAVQNTTAPEQHLDTNVDIYDVFAGDLGYPQDKIKGTDYASCTTAYCHSTGQSTTDGNSVIATYAAPTWNDPSSAACGTCHKVSEASGLTSGSHGAHLGSSGVNGCGDCHAGAANDASAYNSANHVNRQINVDNSYTAGGDVGNGYGTCSTAVCHTTVQGDGGTPGALAVTPEWGTSVTCGECHEAVPTTGKHTVHLTNAGATCGNCHPGAGDGTSIPTANHINGALDIGGGTTEIGTYSSPGIGDGYGTCGTISCHGNNDATWVASTEPPGSLDCIDCHGGTADVDDFDYMNGTTAMIDTNDWTSTGHGGIALPLQCTTCHSFSVPHGSTDNFYRLAAADIGSFCQICHTGLTEHFGPKHDEGAGLNGGNLCVDCHDPHGDSNVFMIHDKPWLGHDADGKPTKVADGIVNFTNNQDWTDFVKPEFNGVCQVCHESSTGIQHFYRYDTYPNVNGGYDVNHNPGAVCTACHEHNAFQPTDCNGCHGKSGETGAPLIASDLVTTSGRGVGAHERHVVEKGYTDCTTCHSGFIMPQTPAELSISFGGIAAGGTYDGMMFSGSDADWSYSPAWPMTSGTRDCSNIYCHSSGQSVTDGSDATPVYATPMWDDPASAVCGTCHKTSTESPLGQIDSGSHAVHLDSAGVAGCGECHTGAADDASSYESANHVNAEINVAAVNTYSADGEPGNGYGDCSTALCHDDATGNQLVTPEWGTDTPNCTVCHEAVPTTGSHQKHLVLTQYSKAACGDCHNGTVQETTGPEEHLDTNIDVYDVNPGDLGYPVDKEKATAYSSCSTAYCHSTGQSTSNGSSPVPTYNTVTWSDPSTAVCGTCHKVSEAEGLISGSHAEHLGTTGVNGCGDCHTGAANDASSYNSVSHINRQINVANTYSAAGAPGNGYGTCSTAPCHDNGRGQPAETPVWGSDSPSCTACHEAAPSTGSHQKHLVQTQYHKPECGDCHDGAVQGTTAPEQHLDNNVDIYDAVPGDLGYPADKEKGTAFASCSTAYCHSTGQSTTDADSAVPVYATPTWDNPATGACGTCHKVSAASGLNSGSHAAHLNSSGVSGCGDCHDGAADDASSYNSTNHVNGQINVKHGYTASGAPGNGYGTCSVAACHGGTSPVWGSDFGGVPDADTCTKCHGTASSAPAAINLMAPPQDLMGDTSPADPQVGAHQAHLTGMTGYFTAVACTECHSLPSSAGSPGHINDITPGSAELTFGTLASNNNASPEYTAGQCSATYCHGNAMPSGSTNGNNKSPVWNNTAYLTGTPSLTGDCAQCHGAPPAISPHTGAESIADCALCHQHFNVDGTLGDASLHMNGVLNAVDCGACHGFPPVSGKHSKHIAAGLDCENCHSQPGGAPNHFNGVVNVNVDPQFAFAAGSPSYDSSSQSCSNVSCHMAPTPAWKCPDDPPGFSCTACHGTEGVNEAPPASLTGATSPTDSRVGAHQVHVTSANGYTSPIDCSECHIKPEDVVVPGHYDDGDNTAEVTFGPLAGNGTYNYSSGECSNTYCHAGRDGGTMQTPVWNDVNYINGTAADCNNCHGTPPGTPSHSSVPQNDLSACTTCHDNWNGSNFVDIGQHIDGDIDASCTGCHSIEQGSRVAVVNQLGQSSHHIQGVEVTNEHCYECHWEANSDGSINNTYHGGWNAPGSAINLVIYGAGSRPTHYNAGTAVSYMANGSRTEISKITSVCLGCHSTQNNNTYPFGDGKTPNEYAWDGQSIDSKYSQSGTTPWGKYVDTSSTDITPKNTQTKAYSGHGNAAANERGWNLSETWPNTSGAVNVMCYDCHNSHGSNVSGVTTSYASATTNGAMLKDTTAGKQGYSMTYKPTADGSAGQNNAHNAGADLCFDCHTTANAGSTPWGYSGTYNSSQPILGYFDTIRFGSGLAGPQQRYSYKSQIGQAKTGHFGVSAPLSTQVNGTIGGLCTPCHDPHGVSPTLNQQYAVPMLKGTWMTSPYKEDVAPASTNECRGTLDEDGNTPAFCGSSTPGYHIDQNTFANWNFNSTASVSESVNEFGGLCVSCHPKSSLSPDTTSQWKSVDRIHNSVKGWDNDGSTKHRYTCAKCHTPHNTALGRLLITNCLDSAHRGRVASGGNAAQASKSGDEGWGSGGHPAGGGGWGEKHSFSYFFGTTSGGRACHDNENNNSFPDNQLWNNVSPW